MILYSLLVAIGGFFGAVSRYGVNLLVMKKINSIFPFGTLIVNLLGSFLLGLILGGKSTHMVTLLFGTGFLGAFTTFSTYKLESLQLGKNKRWGILFLYLGISYIGGILLAYIGYRLMS